MIRFLQKFIAKKRNKNSISFMGASKITAGYTKGKDCEGDIRPFYNK